MAQPAEKLPVSMTLYKYKEFANPSELVNRITVHSGPGHSCGTLVSYPIPSTQPSDVELFGSIMYED